MLQKLGNRVLLGDEGLFNLAARTSRLKHAGYDQRLNHHILARRRSDGGACLSRQYPAGLDPYQCSRRVGLGACLFLSEHCQNGVLP
jgi:hypothetical protein